MLSSLVTIVDLSLAVVFVVAGISKIVDQEGFRTSAREFGFPSWSVPMVVLGLPFIEISIGLALLVSRSALVAAGASVTLLLIFTIAITLQVANGRAPKCHCFGALSGGTVGRNSIARNLILISLGGFATWGEMYYGPIGGLGWLLNLARFELIIVLINFMLLAAVIGEGLVSIHLLNQYGSLVSKLVPESQAGTPPGGLPIGVDAPKFELLNLEGDRWTLDQFLSKGRPVLLVFTEPTCTHCVEMLPDLVTWQAKLKDLISIVAITGVIPSEPNSHNGQFGLDPLLLTPDGTLRESYQAAAVPAAVAISMEGKIQSEIAFGPPSIRELVASVIV